MDTASLTLPAPSTNGTHTLPDFVVLTKETFRKQPSPGTLRMLKAQTGREFVELVGEDADEADRFQTWIWVKLRREFPGLRWDECADVEFEVDADDPGVALNPLDRSDSATSQPSAGSGG